MSCPSVLVLNTNDTVLPASVTASSCQRFSQVISSRYRDHRKRKNEGFVLHYNSRQMKGAHHEERVPSLHVTSWDKSNQMKQKVREMHGCFQQNYQWCEGLNTFKHQLSLEEFHVLKPFYRYYALPQSLSQERLEMESAANPSTLLSIDFSKRTFKKVT